MSNPITVVDYGLGNLFSVSRALEQLGFSAALTDSATGIDAADCVLLPGVGAFGDGMKGLHERGLVEPLRRYGASGRPLLGICLGMQLLFDRSDEFGAAEGLGVIPGGVVAIPPRDDGGRARKIPHIGWNELRPAPGRAGWSGTPLGATAPGTAVYFVHSFTCAPAAPGDRLADCDYDGCVISAAVERGPVCGMQFHPEKSGASGLAILRAFLERAH
jgi:glutamine amidotransferase